jgi:hypothetical protein
MSQLKKVPATVKSLIAREAGIHRRSINQEAIVLSEEACRIDSGSGRFHHGEDVALWFSPKELPAIDARPMSELTEYDELGLLK